MASRLLLLVPVLVSCARSDPAGVARGELTQATADPGHPAVVALVNDGGAITCSGTLIDAHTVLTAAHCLAPPFDRARAQLFFGASLAAGGVRADITQVKLHPDFEPASFRNDLGLITIRQASAAAPVPIDMRALDATVIGQRFEAVGFGITAPGASDTEKRTGAGEVSALSDVELTNTPTSAQACTNDSGGPALFTVDGVTVIGGVASHGDAACADHTAYARVDIARTAFIEPYLASTAAGTAMAGQRCFHDDQCAGGACLVAADEARLSFCSRACSKDRDCPTGMACAADGCRYPTPTPRALGAACTGAADCESDSCFIEPGDSEGVCSRRCVAVGTDCPAGFVCENTATTSFFCLAEPKPDDGCTVAPARGRPGGAQLLWASLVIGLLLIWRARRSPRP